MDESKRHWSILLLGREAICKLSRILKNFHFREKENLVLRNINYDNSV